MERKKKFIINTIYYLMWMGFVYAAVKYALPVLMPFLIAFLIASITNYQAVWISGKFPFPRKAAAVLGTAAFFVILALLVLLAGSKLISFAGELIVKIPVIYKEELLPLLNAAFDNLEVKAAPLDPDIIEKLAGGYETITQDLGRYISEFSVKAVKVLSLYATRIPSFFIQLIITVVASFIMAADYETITGFVIKRLPDKGQKILHKVREYIVSVIFIYIKSYSLLLLITFTELSIGLLLLKVPYAVPIALFIAVFDILPVLGTGGILIPWAAAAGILGEYQFTAGLILLYVVIIIVRNTIEPRIIGRQIGLPAIAALISMFVGLKLFGVIGMIGMPVCLSFLINFEKCGIIDIF